MKQVALREPVIELRTLMQLTSRSQRLSKRTVPQSLK